MNIIQIMQLLIELSIAWISCSWLATRIGCLSFILVVVIVSVILYSLFLVHVSGVDVFIDEVTVQGVVFGVLLANCTLFLSAWSP